jgi:hypothetical protein
MEDASEYGVGLRRKEVAKRYINGDTNSSIWRWYEPTYKLSRESMDNDIAICRQSLNLDVKANYEQILSDSLQLVLSVIEEVRTNTGITVTEKSNLLLKCQGNIVNTLKLVTDKKSNQVNVQINQTNNTLNLPNNVPSLDSSQLEELKKLLGRDSMDTVPIDITQTE